MAKWRVALSKRDSCFFVPADSCPEGRQVLCSQIFGFLLSRQAPSLGFHGEFIMFTTNSNNLNILQRQ